MNAFIEQLLVGLTIALLLGALAAARAVFEQPAPRFELDLSDVQPRMRIRLRPSGWIRRHVGSRLLLEQFEVSYVIRPDTGWAMNREFRISTVEFFDHRDGRGIGSRITIRGDQVVFMNITTGMNTPQSVGRYVLDVTASWGDAYRDGFSRSLLVTRTHAGTAIVWLDSDRPVSDLRSRR